MKQVNYFVVFLFALTFLLFSNTDVKASETREVKTVSLSQLVVKKAATNNSATVATLKKGDFVTVFSSTNGWSHVQVKNVKGYVDGASLAKVNSTIKVASSKSGLVVKENPTKSGKTVANLKHNMIVEDFGSVGGSWSFVQYGNVTGYVATSFIGKPKTAIKYINNEAGADVRNIASPSGTYKGTIEHNTKVTTYSSLAGWTYVSSDNLRGYVPTAQLTNKAILSELANIKSYAQKGQVPVATKIKVGDPVSKLEKIYGKTSGWGMREYYVLEYPRFSALYFGLPDGSGEYPLYTPDSNIYNLSALLSKSYSFEELKKVFGNNYERGYDTIPEEIFVYFNLGKYNIYFTAEGYYSPDSDDEVSLDSLIFNGEYTITSSN